MAHILIMSKEDLLYKKVTVKFKSLMIVGCIKNQTNKWTVISVKMKDKFKEAIHVFVMVV